MTHLESAVLALSAQVRESTRVIELAKGRTAREADEAANLAGADAYVGAVEGLRMMEGKDGQ